MTTKTVRKRRQRHGGLKKICRCPRRAWAGCSHSWHFAFKPKSGPRVRLSLDRYLGRPVESKTEAEDLAGDLRKQIRAGTFRPDGSASTDTVLTLQGLVDRYLPAVRPFRKHARSVRDTAGALAAICAMPIPTATGEPLAFGAWPVESITRLTVEHYRAAHMARGAGIGGSNRSLGRLRALLAWGVSQDLLPATPFRKNGHVVVKLHKEQRRSRRLYDGEAEALLAQCGPRLRALVEAALETGMRLGEITGLRWRQIHGHQVQSDGRVTWDPKAVIALTADDTKTSKARQIPISSRLRALLEMRRCDPNGTPLGGDTFVFGSALGTRIGDPKRAWLTAVLKAHGYAPTFTKKTANLDRASRDRLKEVDLHFHDLRREAASRWLDAGVPMTVIQRWLGHTTLGQTATYLAAAVGAEHDAMTRFDTQRASCHARVTDAGTGGHERPSPAIRPASVVPESTKLPAAVTM